MKIQFCVFLFIFLVTETTVEGRTNTRLSPNDIGHLESISKETESELRRIDPLVLPLDVTSENILSVDLTTAQRITEVFVSEGWSTFEFFTHPFFGQGEKILYYSPDVLAGLNRQFRIPTLFPIAGHGEIPDNKPFSMRGLLLGKGRIVVLYSSPIEVQRLEKPLSMLTGRYSFFRVNIVTIEQENNQPCLCSLKGRNNPSQKLQAIRGPLNFSIRKIKNIDGARRIRVIVPWGFFNVPSPLFARNSPPV